MAIPVFWAMLAWVPRNILSRVHKLCSKFLWAGSKEEKVLPWVAWDRISRPKDWGGWGIKYLLNFLVFLVTKMGWRILYKYSLWSQVMKRKYIDPLEISEWLHEEGKKPYKSFVVLKAILGSINIIDEGLV